MMITMKTKCLCWRLVDNNKMSSCLTCSWDGAGCLTLCLSVSEFRLRIIFGVISLVEKCRERSGCPLSRVSRRTRQLCWGSPWWDQSEISCCPRSDRSPPCQPSCRCWTRPRPPWTRPWWCPSESCSSRPSGKEWCWRPPPATSGGGGQGRSTGSGTRPGPRWRPADTGPHPPLACSLGTAQTRGQSSRTSSCRAWCPSRGCRAAGTRGWCPRPRPWRGLLIERDY